MAKQGSGNSKNSGRGKIGVLAKVTTPLAFLALIVLVVEGTLLSLAVKATGMNLTILEIGMVISLFALIYIGAGMVKSQPIQPVKQISTTHDDSAPINFKYDVFVSCPMAAFDKEDEYKASRKEILEFASALRLKANFMNIYYAGLDINSPNDFDAPDISAEDVLNAVSASKYFVLIYLSKVVSSSLLEAGCALAQRKPSVYFVRSRDDLPFLMKKAEQAFPNNVKIHECKNMTEILHLLEKHRSRLFPKLPNLKADNENTH